jgi:molybdopterin-binding protein
MEAHVIAYEEMLMEISARNQIKGKVKALRTGTIMAEVEVSIGPAELTAVITKSSVDRLRLKKGQTVRVIIKSTELMIGK